MSKLDWYTRQLLGAAPLYENWFAEGVDKDPVEAFIPGVARQPAASPRLVESVMGDGSKPLDPGKFPGSTPATSPVRAGKKDTGMGKLIKPYVTPKTAPAAPVAGVKPQNASVEHRGSSVMEELKARMRMGESEDPREEARRIKALPPDERRAATKALIKDASNSSTWRMLEKSIEDNKQRKAVAKSEPKSESVMSHLRTQMGITEANDCGCGCGGRGFCGAAKAANEARKKTQEEDVARRAAARLEHEQYSEELQLLRKLCGIESAHEDITPPVTRIPILGLGMGKSMW